MKLSHVLSHQRSVESLSRRKATPWIASPLATVGAPSPHHSHEETENKSNFSEPVVEIQEPHQHHSEAQAPAFREHHESSTVELFFDLFFVANLATFTANHEIVDAASLKNYMGFFTLLWFTWLEYSLFDVRFSTDSVFNRTAKAVSFGVMTGFAVCGAIYDTSNIEENAKAFRAMALILMASRLALFIQYGVVLFYVRKYKNTVWPLASTMLTLFVAAMIFLGTFFSFPENNPAEVSFPNEKGGNTYIAWYVISVCEAMAIIAVSCIWRVVSFRHTHLVERVGLLTLIIMGEGIIGMTKSVSVILQNSSAIHASDVGAIIASVLLIYFIWVLYFDQIEHDRFGTIRQQIWAILHFPLHAAILLTVEGSTTLIVWNIINYLSTTWENMFVYSNVIITTSEELVDFLNKTINVFSENFKNVNISASFDYSAIFDEILHIKAPSNSKEWYNEAQELELDVVFGILNFVFEQFKIEAPERKSDLSEHESQRLQDEFYSLFQVFNTIFYYFYIAAGCFLMILAVMYYFGKTHKSRGEYASIFVRLIAGAGVTVGLLAGTNIPSAFSFDMSAWLIPIVTISFFVVIIVDNFLVWHTNHTIARSTSNNRYETFTVRDTARKTSMRESNDTVSSMTSEDRV